MVAAEVALKVKNLEIRTRRFLSGSSVGASKSRRKGFGLDFDQLRPYEHGDDVRFIDWKSSARSIDQLMVRQCFEEKSRTFMICLDVSASTIFGSGDILKQEAMRQIAGALIIAANYGKDAVGLILFSDTVEKVIAPSRGHKHMQNLIHQIFSYSSSGKKTNLTVLFDYVAEKIVKRSAIFVLSDFIAQDFEKSLKKVVFDKELISVICHDDQEEMLSNVGLVWMKDPETDDLALVNTVSSSASKIGAFFKNRADGIKKILKHAGSSCVSIRAETDFMEDLIKFFQK